jgi:elongation factor Ts
MPGIIESYIHTGNYVGALVEISCQHEWVAKTKELKALAKDIAMQVVVYPQVQYVKITDIPVDVIQQEKVIEMSRNDLSNKPFFIQEEIVQSRLKERLRAMNLLDQVYIKDSDITVKDLIELYTAQLSDDIQVRRFVRFITDEPFNPPPPTSGSSFPSRPLPGSPGPLASEEKPE